MANIVIVGAGPVGLLLCHQLREAGFSSIAMIEKRAAYTREQILVLWPDTLALLPITVRRDLFQSRDHPSCFVIPPSKDLEGVCFNDTSGRLAASVVTRVLEEHLARYVSSLGILILRPKVPLRVPAGLLTGRLPFSMVVRSDSYIVFTGRARAADLDLLPARPHHYGASAGKRWR
jgi:hypothetical protein